MNFRISILLLLFLFGLNSYAQNKTDKAEINTSSDSVLVYKFNIMDEIGPATWRITKQSIEKAVEIKADYILLHLNTYGGLVDAADSIRTKILNCPIPVYAFIDNNAASAGALISIACDSIYMREGGNIGAATVVHQTGEAAPDKYQSYMRSMMRATAEAHGADTIITDKDTTIRWFRNPTVAEAMVDQSIEIEGITVEGKVLTFTTNEAIKHGFCEGKAKNTDEVLKKAGITNYKIYQHNVTQFEKFMGILISPYLQGILIMIIIGGIYFELQSPGIGFPIFASLVAAVIYFAPLYLEGIAEHWEIFLFIIGIILLMVEVFVLPGFGVAGILGATFAISGLVLSLIDNIVFDFEGASAEPLFRATALVLTSSLGSLILSLYLGKKMLTEKGALSVLVLKSTQNKEEGFIGIDMSMKQFVGRIATAATVLRPSGIIEIDNEQYDAKSIASYIDKGKQVEIISTEAGQLYVREVK